MITWPSCHHAHQIYTLHAPLHGHHAIIIYTTYTHLLHMAIIHIIHHTHTIHITITWPSSIIYTHHIHTPSAPSHGHHAIIHTSYTHHTHIIHISYTHSAPSPSHGHPTSYTRIIYTHLLPHHHHMAILPFFAFLCFVFGVSAHPPNHVM